MAAYFTFFIFGLIVGSFLNCAIYRLEKGESCLHGRSYCPLCRHQLSWLDLIPLLSFLFLKGKCRYCQKKISWQYPLVEMATGLLFVLNVRISDFLSSFNVWEIGYLDIIACFLIIIFVYDLKYYIIPDKVIYPAIGIALIFDLLRSDFQWKSDFLISAVGAAAFFLAIVLISRGKWMGAGDIKLAFLMGLFLGWPSIAVALFLAFLSGAIIGVGLVFAKKKELKSEIPFGPFLVGGAFIALFCGQNIINWYLNLILI
ncbi:MAG: prepilin peptidase [bacterium]